MCGLKRQKKQTRAKAIFTNLFASFSEFQVAQRALPLRRVLVSFADLRAKVRHATLKVRPNFRCVKGGRAQLYLRKDLQQRKWLLLRKSQQKLCVQIFLQSYAFYLSYSALLTQQQTNRRFVRTAGVWWLLTSTSSVPCRALNSYKPDGSAKRSFAKLLQIFLQTVGRTKLCFVRALYLSESLVELCSTQYQSAPESQARF